MSEELIEGVESTMDSGGTYGFEADDEDDAIKQDREWQEYKREQRKAEMRRATEIIYNGQNNLVEKIASMLDENFPPEEYGNGHGTGYVSPGALVRACLVDVEKALREQYGD